MSSHRLEKTRGIHKLVRHITLLIILWILDLTSNFVLDADALILLVALLRKHVSPHIDGQVVDSEVDVHDGVQLFLSGDHIE